LKLETHTKDDELRDRMIQKWWNWYN